MDVKSKQPKSKPNKSKPKPPPKCRYGSECRNIKKGCKFAHPETVADAAKTPEDKSRIPCRYRMGCRYAECPYFHHPSAGPAVVECNEPLPPSSKPQQPSSPANKSKKKCRHGAKCRNKKCIFSHPDPSSSIDTKEPNIQESDIHKPHIPRKVSATDADAQSIQSANTPLSGFTSEEPPPPGFSHTPLFAKGSNNMTPTSQRTPLYNRVPRQSSPKDLPMDEDWVFEVLGLDAGPMMGSVRNDNGKASGIQNDHVDMGQKRRPNHGSKMQNRSLNSQRSHGMGTRQSSNTQRQPTSKSVDRSVKREQQTTAVQHEIVDRETVVLLSQNEVDRATKTANELRLISQQQSSHLNSDRFFSLLEQCSTEQKKVQSALEDAMNPTNGVASDIDESNLMAVLELNEMLLRAIKLAESSGIGDGLDRKVVPNGAKKVESSKKSDAKSKANGKAKTDATKRKPQRNDNGNATKAKPSEIQKLEPQVVKANSNRNTRKARSLESKDESQNEVTPITNKTKPSVSESVGEAETTKAIAKTQSKVSEKLPSQQPKSKTTKSEKILQSNVVSPATTNASSDNSNVQTANVPEPQIDPSVAVKEEKERMARLVQEAREQAAAAKEKKKSKKSKKFDAWLKEQELAKEARAKAWTEKISKEIDYIALIQKLLIAEFLRQSKNKAMGLTSERVLSDDQASTIIETECRDVYYTIFETKARIVVAGSDNKELNGRQGTIRYWDKEKEKFCVGLDTKKSNGSNEMFLAPDVLDVAASPFRSNKSHKSDLKASFDVEISELMTYGGVALSLNFTLKKSHIAALGSAESTKSGLKSFCDQRDQEERQKKLDEEQEKIREEEDRKRRAAKKAAENAAWERRKEQMRRDKEEYENMRKQWRSRDGNDGGSGRKCNCPECRFDGSFFGMGSGIGGSGFKMGSGMHGSSGFFYFGGIPFRVNFGSDSDDGDFFGDFDDEWEEQMLEEKMEENRKQAEILGVEPNADERALKVAYRKLALRYHPDKWKSDSEHGMSKEDAENKFKAVQSAYDHLMSNLDESDDNYGY